MLIRIFPSSTVAGVGVTRTRQEPQDMQYTAADKNEFLNEYLFLSDDEYRLLLLECHFFFLKSQSIIYFSMSLLPCSFEKRPMRLRLEIEIE